MKNLISKIFGAERDMEIFIGKFLRWGVTIACGITLLGGVIYLLQQEGRTPDYTPIPNGEHFSGTASYLHELITIIPRALSFDGAAIIQLGVCILIATPVLRVALSVFGFLIERDYMYVVITLIVLFIIVANMVLGLH